MIPARVADHVAAFNDAVRSGGFGPFGDRFADDAVMRFVGVPAGPYGGRAAIAAGYAESPPDDTLTVRSVTTSGDTDTVAVRWDHGGDGTMVLRWRDGLVAELTVSFG